MTLSATVQPGNSAARLVRRGKGFKPSDHKPPLRFPAGPVRRPDLDTWVMSAVSSASREAEPHMALFPRLAAVIVLAGLAGSAAAQLPFPLPGQPDSDLSKRPQCTRDYLQSVEQQIVALDKIRSAGPEAVGQICSLIEMGSYWLGGELPDNVRKQLKDSFGFDIDLRYITIQCRVSQGNLDRELMTQLGFLKSELVRCNDTI
jgi:hypothetical protein